MAINFPNNPTLNQTYSVGSSTWYWDGNQWSIYVNTSPSFVNITATGTLTANVLSSPTLNDYVTNTSLTSTLNGYATNTALSGLTSTVNNSSITVNGVSIQLNGSGTVPAEAGTLTGTALHSTVISSNLTSLGTLTSVTVSGLTTLNTATISGNVTANSNISVATLPTQKQHLTNKQYVDAKAIGMAIGLS